MTDLDKMILRTFIYEENTILHVENHLKSNGINEPRKEIKSRLSTLLDNGLVKLYDVLSNGNMDFNDTNDKFEEDCWFFLTDEGKKDVK